MIFSWKPFSRLSSVHQGEPDQEEEASGEEEQKRVKCSSGSDNHNYVNELATCSRFTVWRKSLVISCNGFTVINSKGELAYRVDNYMGRPEELVLMDASGQPVLTMLRHKKLGVAERWVIYEGEVDHLMTRATIINKSSSALLSKKKPTWCVRKHMSGILKGRHEGSVLANVFRGVSCNNKIKHSYVVEGSYSRRSCTVMDEARRVVAEVKRKEAMVGGVSFGLEVFHLIVQPDFDHGIAMALVLLLDQMYS